MDLPISEITVPLLDERPLRKIDWSNVKRLRDAAESGADLPAIRVGRVPDDPATYVVDGRHRIEARRQQDGDNAAINANVEEFDNMTDLLIAAAEANAEHGLNYSDYAKRDIIQRFENMGVPPTRIAPLLGLSPEQFQRRSLVGYTRRGPVGAEQVVPIQLKQPLKHLDGQEITDTARRVNEKAAGHSVVAWANQIRAHLSARTLNASDRRLIVTLATLRSELDVWLQEVMPEAEEVTTG